MPKLILTHRDLQSILTRRDLKSVLSNRLLQAEAVLDPDTKNRYFRSGHEATMTDLYISAFSKRADDDSFAFADSNLTDFSALKTDSFAFSDTPSVVMQFNRSFTDAFALDDAATVDALIKDMANAKTNVFGFADDQAFGVGKGLSDSFGFADAVDSFGIGKGLTDSQPMTESLSRTVTYFRSFTDAFAMDDAATVDALQKATGALKQNIFSMGDTFGRTVVFNRQFTDSVTPTEDHAVSFSKAATTDTFTVTESLSRAVTYNRSFSESQSFGDVVGGHVIGKGLSETQTISESHASALSLGKTDSFSVSESSVSLLNKAASDALSFGDSLARTVTYSRSFTDAFSMDDAATVNALVKDHANAKTNVFGFSDSQAFGFSKTATDTFSFADAFDSVGVGKGLSDSVSMTENFSFALFSNAAMNAAQLNSAPFNE